ncbi:MAG: cell division protein FtsZ [Candidatus Omnitrophica bacterium]|nr:cell division protein FtsZ [Candidatus Omnitrophota bacterium]
MQIRIAEKPGDIGIKVVGVGGSGGNMVSRMADKLTGVTIAAVNTDFQALSEIKAPIKFLIGRRLTRGLGAGGNPELGRVAAEEDRLQLSQLLKGARIVFLTMGMGGGTGTGAGPVIAEIAKNNGALVIGLVNLPFSFDGPVKMEIAQKGIEEFKKYADTLITIPNDKIFELLPTNTKLTEAFEKIDEVFYQGVSGISDLLTKPGHINLDFADLRTIIKNGGDGLMGIGTARGPDRAEKAAGIAAGNPFLRKESLMKSRHILVSITGSDNLTVFEINQVMKTVETTLPAQAKKFTGVALDPQFQDAIKVMVVATGLENVPIVETEPESINYKPRKRNTGESKIGDNQPLLFDNEGDLPAHHRKKLGKN